jgi:hypothetical protein
MILEVLAAGHAIYVIGVTKDRLHARAIDTTMRKLLYCLIQKGLHVLLKTAARNSTRLNISKVLGTHLNLRSLKATIESCDMLAICLQAATQTLLIGRKMEC